MAEVNYGPKPNQASLAPAKSDARAWMRAWWFRLLGLLVFIELIWPFLLWQAGLRQRADFTKEIVAGVIVALTLLFILVRNRIPGGVLLMLGVTLIWGLIAAFEGQAITVTFWGWWRLFKYPILAFFIYMMARWPSDGARLIFKFLVITLAFEVVVQLGQFAMGQPPGDSLAGTFGNKGVGPYSMFIFFTVSIALGHWLATGEWKVLGLVLLLGFVATTLSVTKFYLFATAVLLAFALVLHLVRGGRFRHLFLYVALFILAGAAFVPIYNNFIAATRGLKPLQDYLTRGAIEGYLFKEEESSELGRYKLGRGGAVVYAWQQIQRDRTTTLFGYGMGSRSYSQTLGIAGATLEDDLYGGGGNTGLGVWIQEYGLIGMGLFMAMNFWIMGKLFRHARRTSDPYQATLAFGLLIFTFFWPMWLWYHKVWIFGVMMICYWVTLGFVMQQIYPRLTRAVPQPQPLWMRDEAEAPSVRPSRTER